MPRIIILLENTLYIPCISTKLSTFDICQVYFSQKLSISEEIQSSLLNELLFNPTLRFYTESFHKL